MALYEIKESIEFLMDAKNKEEWEEIILRFEHLDLVSADSYDGDRDNIVKGTGKRRIFTDHCTTYHSHNSTKSSEKTTIT